MGVSPCAHYQYALCFLTKKKTKLLVSHFLLFLYCELLIGQIGQSQFDNNPFLNIVALLRVLCFSNATLPHVFRAQLLAAMEKLFFTFPTVPVDLSPEERSELEDIRRRKGVLLQEIQRLREELREAILEVEGLETSTEGR